MTVTYQIEAEELNDSFLESLRSLFKGRRLVVTVEEEKGVVTSPVMIEKLNQVMDSPDTYIFEGESFSEFTNMVLNEGLTGLERYIENEK